MKKIFILLIMILSSIIFAEKIKIKGEGANLRSAPMGNVIGKAYPGINYEILDSYGPWTFVTIEESKGTSVKNGKKGWMTTKLVDKTTGIVKDPGCNFRLAPDKKSERIGVILPGSKVKVIKTLNTWYKIKNGDILGWVWTGATEIIQDKK